MSSRKRISTHWFRRTARAAVQQYHDLQARAIATDPHPSSASAELAVLGLGRHDRLTTERAKRGGPGAWVVYAESPPSAPTRPKPVGGSASRKPTTRRSTPPAHPRSRKAQR